MIHKDIARTYCRARINVRQPVNFRSKFNSVQAVSVLTSSECPGTMAACDDDDLREGPPAKKQKRAVCRKTVEKWIVENDRTLNTAVWLKFETDRRDHVHSLKCTVCSQFKDRLTSIRNYRPAFVEGKTNVRTSPFKDHAATDMHAHAMTLCNTLASSRNTRRSRRPSSVRRWTQLLGNKPNVSSTSPTRSLRRPSRLLR